jgi:hypothetical protein
MDSYKVDLLIKFALTAAGQEDPGNRELGPIHLVKYVYLGDLAYAKRFKGETFTGIPWRFHHFGPWSPEVYERIKPVVQATGASERKYSHPKYEDDFVRWSLMDEELYDEIEKHLPFCITTAIKRAVHEFGADTQSLLHYVYITEPILKAAPQELLSFDFQNEGTDNIKESNEDGSSQRALSAKEKKRRKAKIQALKDRIQHRLSEKSKTKKLVSPHTPSRYDEVFFEGQEWLDHLAGSAIEPQSGQLFISEEVWKSRARFDPDVS